MMYIIFYFIIVFNDSSLHIFFIIYIDKFWFYIFIRIYILFGGIKENKGPRRAWPQSDTRMGSAVGTTVLVSVRTTGSPRGEPPSG